jgi:hypothetical protein
MVASFSMSSCCRVSMALVAFSGVMLSSALVLLLLPLGELLGDLEADIGERAALLRRLLGAEIGGIPGIRDSTVWTRDTSRGGAGIFGQFICGDT